MFCCKTSRKIVFAKKFVLKLGFQVLIWSTFAASTVLLNIGHFRPCVSKQTYKNAKIIYWKGFVAHLIGPHKFACT